VRPGAVGVVIVGLIVAAGMGACSDDGGEALSRAAFLAKGNVVCKQSEDRLKEVADQSFTKGEEATPDKVETFAKKTVVPELKKQIDALDELKPNKNDKDQVNDILSSARKAAGQIDDDPTIIMSGETPPLQEYGDRANGFGLKACGSFASRVSDVLTGKSSAR
jgi:hypothetical protein